MSDKAMTPDVTRCWWKKCRRKAIYYIMVGEKRRKLCEGHFDQVVKTTDCEYLHKCQHCHTYQGVGL